MKLEIEVDLEADDNDYNYARFLEDSSLGREDLKNYAKERIKNVIVEEVIRDRWWRCSKIIEQEYDVDGWDNSERSDKIREMVKSLTGKEILRKEFELGLKP